MTHISKYRALLTWLFKRLLYLRKEMVQWYEKAIYQKQSQFLLHPWNAQRCPYEAILFYNFPGRILFGIKEFLALISNEKIFKKSIALEGFDRSPPQNTTPSLPYQSLWPPSPMYNNKTEEPDEAFLAKIALSYRVAKKYRLTQEHHTDDWKKVVETFQDILFDKEGKIDKEALFTFRHNHRFETIIADTFTQVDTQNSYFAEYLKAIDLILAYHRSAAVVDKEILATLSESYAGGSNCVRYRGLRLSEKLLFYAVVTQDILHHVPHNPLHKEVILDIGTGYGGVPGILKYYLPNTTQILIDLPEVITIAAYYIKYNFPDAKIVLLCDIDTEAEKLPKDWRNYDFILLTPAFMPKLHDNSVDLVINTASMGFLTHTYLEYYLQQIARILKRGGHFYSVNKTESCKWGVGMYAWRFKEQYVTIALNYNNRFEYPQWLGRKI